MAVDGSEPISAGNLDGLFPVPIALGGTGATNAGDAIVTLGIDTFVQEAVENYFDIQDANWTGSGSAAVGDNWYGKITFSLAQSSASSGITMSGNGIYVAKAGTYRFTGTITSPGTGFSSYSQSGASVALSDGRVIGTANVDPYQDFQLVGSILKSLTFSSPMTFSVSIGPNNGSFISGNDNSTVKLTNFRVQRIA